MAYLYLDDSKHHKSGFSLAAFVICDTDPNDEVSLIFSRFGFDPSSFEFKSSANMKDNPNLQKLRGVLRSYIQKHCKIAICVVDGDKRLGPAALKLLHSVLTHPDLRGEEHHVFFDEGLFRSGRTANTFVDDDETLSDCTFHFEQNSSEIIGIQLADLVAHTCSIMLLEALGHVSKMVVLDMPKDEAYHSLEVELGFEMWAGIRYAFLSQNQSNPTDDIDFANVDVFPWGLFIDSSVEEAISAAAMGRFGENYLGCIH